jgi:hypothetical protein
MLGWLVFGAVATVCATASGENKEFRSWYDGWGMHKVWGLGIVKASYAHGFVTCGRAKFKVMPVYDVHSDKRLPLLSKLPLHFAPSMSPSPAN